MVGGGKKRSGQSSSGSNTGTYPKKRSGLLSLTTVVSTIIPSRSNASEYLEAMLLSNLIHTKGKSEATIYRKTHENILCWARQLKLFITFYTLIIKMSRWGHKRVVWICWDYFCAHRNGISTILCIFNSIFYTPLVLYIILSIY